MTTDYIEAGSIAVPGKWVHLCERWHAGKSSMCYAIATAGNVPFAVRTPTQVTAEQRYHGCYLQLVYELRQMVSLSQHASDDQRRLQLFLAWAESQAARLQENYQLEC